MEDSIGSIDVGKQANFTVLGESPYAVPPMNIRDIAVEATILEGRVYPVAASRHGSP
jgi:predicted amidohydrolase YtcJ